MSNKRLIVNAYGCATWRHRPVGIIRVERELLKQIRKRSSAEVVHVMFNPEEKANTWRCLSNNKIDEILDDKWVSQHDLSTGIEFNKLKKFVPQKGDTFISAGSDWSHSVAQRVEDLYKGERVFVSACHDLIPLKFPEYTPGPEFKAQFHEHYSGIAKIGKAVFAVSENSKKDLLEYWQRCDYKDTPPVEAVPLAGIDKQTDFSMSPENEGRHQWIANGGDYVIYVTTVEPRKNHQLLLDVWRELYKERGDACPRLVIVGVRGWGVDDLLSQMDRMQATKAGKILFEQGVTDDLLRNLYKTSLFAVFPSYYEGWGLAATEAISYNKVCVISNISALQEAVGGGMPAYHPNDFMGWYKEIKKLIDDRSYRETVQAAISQKMLNRTWDDFGKELFSKVL